MKSLIIYESFFGNTEKIAQAIAGSINGTATKAVDFKVEQLNDIELLVVGSPTRAFRPSPAITKFLNSLPSGKLKNIKVASFDTGISKEDTPVAFLRFMIGIFGYACKPISKSLIKKGGQPIAEPTTFWVNGTEGPLKEREIERAKNWLKV